LNLVIIIKRERQIILIKRKKNKFKNNHFRMLLNQSWKSKLVVLFKKSEFLKNLVKIKKKKKIVAMRIFMILIQISVIDLLLNIMKTLLFYQNIKNQKELHNRKKNKKR